MRPIAPCQQLHNLNVGSRGPANLSFTSCAQLVTQYRAYRFSLSGCDENNIDCIYIPSGEDQGGDDIVCDINRKRDSSTSDYHISGDSCSSSDDNNNNNDDGNDDGSGCGPGVFDNDEEVLLKGQAPILSPNETDSERAMLLDAAEGDGCAEYGC